MQQATGGAKIYDSQKKRIVINDGQRLRATTIEGQNTFASSLCFA